VLGPYDPPLIEAGRLTLPAMLKQRGYHTACIGKWHLGWNWPKAATATISRAPSRDGPTTRGFDYYFGTCVPNYPPYCFIRNDRTVAFPPPKKPPRTWTGAPVRCCPAGSSTGSCRLWRRRRAATSGSVESKAAFFLYMPLTSPHEPIAPSERFRGASGINPVADFILETDWAVGQVLAALDEHRIARETLVIFTSDNGHCPYTGLPPLLEKGHKPGGPLRGYKSSIYEGGHRIPFVARWPGRIRPGGVCGHTSAWAT